MRAIYVYFVKFKLHKEKKMYGTRSTFSYFVLKSVCGDSKKGYEHSHTKIFFLISYTLICDIFLPMHLVYRPAG